MARLGAPVGGRVRKLRAVEDQSAPIPEEITSELGGTICSLARRPQYDQHGCHSLEESMDIIQKWETYPTEDRNEKEDVMN